MMRFHLKLNLRAVLLALLAMLVGYSLWLTYREYSYEQLVHKTIGDAASFNVKLKGAVIQGTRNFDGRLSDTAKSDISNCTISDIKNKHKCPRHGVPGEISGQRDVIADENTRTGTNVGAVKPMDTKNGADTDRQLELKHSLINIYNFSMPVHSDFHCVQMKTKPPFAVCIYPVSQDVYISHDLATTGLWEPTVLFDFMDVLRRDPDVGVIDIGANLGVYSLLAAHMGHPVVAVEPYIESCRRLHKSAKIGRTTERMLLLQNGIADVRSGATIIENGENQGDTRLHVGVRPCQGSCPSAVNTILLDDLLLVTTFKRAVMKLDCQGCEHLAFKHASKLLTMIDITHIYMEWMVLASFYSGANKDAVEELVKLLLTLDYRPFSLDMEGSRSLDPELWHKWPTDVVWRRLPDEKQQRQLWKNHFMNWP